MTDPQILIFLVLAGVLVFFIWGRWRYDLVAFAGLMATVLLGLVAPEDAFSGFGHPATVTVALVLVLSRSLANAGVGDLVAGILTPIAKTPLLLVISLSLIGAVMSAFMNNVGALAILMPVALELSARCKCPPSMVLMPLSFATILGGLSTEIGTPPNIIIAAYRGQTSDAAFTMFDFSPVGGTVAIAGVLFVSLLGWRLVKPQGKGEPQGSDLFEIDDYVAEAKIADGSDLIGLTQVEAEDLIAEYDLQIVGVIQGKTRYLSLPRRETLRTGTVLIIEAGPDELDRFVSEKGLTIPTAHTPGKGLLQTDDLGLMEAVISPGSRIEGRKVESLRLRSRYQMALLAISRQGRPYRGRLRDFRLRVGDVLLLQGDRGRMADVITSLGCLPLAERGLQFGQRHRLLLAIAIFAGAIALASFGILGLPIALGVAAAGMVMVGLVSPRDLYDGIDWPVIVLLGAMIPVGGALEHTGATTLMVKGLLDFGHGTATVLILVTVLVATMTLSDILNNAATAVVMAPIGAGLAYSLGVNADPFLMAVAVGASCAFLTPIGHQNNALVMGPGGYKFGDYWRMGLPLEALIVAVSVPMILIVWPL